MDEHNMHTFMIVYTKHEAVRIISVADFPIIIKLAYPFNGLYIIACVSTIVKVLFPLAMFTYAITVDSTVLSLKKPHSSQRLLICNKHPQSNQWNTKLLGTYPRNCTHHLLIYAGSLHIIESPSFSSHTNLYS